MKDLFCKQAVDDKGGPSWQGQNGKTACKGMWQPRGLMGGGARLEDMKAKLLLSPSPRTGMAVHPEAWKRLPLGGPGAGLAFSPHLAYLPDIKEAPGVGALKSFIL